LQKKDAIVTLVLTDSLG